LKVWFLGVRGSTPAPGVDFAGVGGNTSCVALARDGEDQPTLVLDAGTGITRLSGLLGGSPFRGTILLSHLHWDHVQGLPFTPAADRDDAEVVLALPDQGDGTSALDVLGRAMSPPHFPIDPTGLRGSWRFELVSPGCAEREGFEVTALEVAHKGGVTFGYRVNDGRSTLAYLPDHATVGTADERLRANARQLVEGVDDLIHDAQFVTGEEVVAADYGHALVSDAVGLAVEGDVRRLWLFHHGPGRTDGAVETIAGELGGQLAGQGLEVHVATERTIIEG
jgi:ribonuclease BN (tRNA processing enzyme)